MGIKARIAVVGAVLLGMFVVPHAASAQNTEDTKRLLRLMNIPVVEAPSEAEATCAHLVKEKLCDVVASEDADALTFGASPGSREVTLWPIAGPLIFMNVSPSRLAIYSIRVVLP